MDSIKKFLEFNGKTILYIDKNGVYWIAIKSICDALEVDYIRQYKNLNSDPILAPALSKQTIQTPQSQPRNMVCIPEKYVYGWIFQIRSDSPALLEYKWKVYEILFDYFQGTITGRKFLLEGKTKKQLRREHIESQLLSDDRFREYISLGIEINQDSKKLRDLDRQIITGQLDLWKHEM
jgi:hypothetical protein